MASVVYSSFAVYILASFVGQTDSHLNQYNSVVSEVHEYYGTASVFLVLSRNNCLLEDYTLAHSLSRDFSRKHDFTSTFYLDQLDDRMNGYHKRIGQSLIVVFLRTLSDITEFGDNTKFMSKSYIWLVIFTNDSTNSVLCEYCKSPKENRFGLRFDTEMLVLCCDSLVLEEWWSINGEHVEVSDFAVCMDENRKKLTFLASTELEARRHDVKGAEIRIGLVKSSVLAYEVEDEIRGLFADILVELKRSMNFTIKGIVRSIGTGILNTDTKNWTGIIGRLIQGDVDLAVADFSITNNRLEVLDYTLPLAISKSKLYIKERGDGASVYWTAYFQTFSANIWIVTILLIILASILLAAIKVFRRSRSLLFLIVESYLHVWGIFCQQGLGDFPAQTSLRIAYFSIFILALIIYAAYSASLASFLTISPSGLPFTTLDGFVNDGSYRLIVIKDTVGYEFFANSSIPVLKKMMALMKPVEELPETLSDGWDQVCQGKVALYTDDLSVTTSQLHTKCKAASIDSGYGETLAMAIPAGSQYRSVINYHIQRFKDTGVMDRIKHKYYVSTYTPAEAKFDQFNLMNVAPVLAALIAGIILALLVLFGECMYCSVKTKERSRQHDIFSRVF